MQRSFPDCLTNSPSAGKLLPDRSVNCLYAQTSLPVYSSTAHSAEYIGRTSQQLFLQKHAFTQVALRLTTWRFVLPYIVLFVLFVWPIGKSEDRLVVGVAGVSGTLCAC